MTSIGRIWFVDIEGNGAVLSEAIEIATVESVDLVPTGQTRRWLIRPTTPISRHATLVHGITDLDLADAPTIEKIRPEIERVLDDSDIAGHAICGDLDVLARDVPGARPSSALDTLVVARRLLGDTTRHGLQAVVEHLELDRDVLHAVGGRPHTALYDAMASLMVTSRLRDISSAYDFAKAFGDSHSLARWDRMVLNRGLKAQKAAEDRRTHAMRRAMRNPNR